jgi:pimeloyl-ACP methyl ester carboxylesterase
VSFPGQFIDTSAGRVFVHRRGPRHGLGAAPPGSPLVLIHGFMMSHWMLRSVLEPLGRTREVIALDLPGFGESDRPLDFAYDSAAFARVVVEVLDRLGVARAGVVAHSMGGGAALVLAARHPDRVARLVLVCPAVYPLELQLEQKLLTTRLGPFLWKHLLPKRFFESSWRSRYVRDPRAVTDEHVEHVWERLNRPGGREAAFTAAMALTKLTNNSADPGRVRAPTLLLWPEEDRVVPLAHGKRLARAIPGAVLRVIPACGHDPFLDRPDQLWRELAPFLDETVAVRSAS